MKRLVQNIITYKNGRQKPYETEVGLSCLQVFDNPRTEEDDRFEERLREIWEYRYYIIANDNLLEGK